MGTLHGYRFLVSYSGDSWHFDVIDMKGYSKLCPRVASFVEDTRRARDWTERQIADSASG